LRYQDQLHVSFRFGRRLIPDPLLPLTLYKAKCIVLRQPTGFGDTVEKLDTV
jgi:hypothetical protein